MNRLDPWRRALVALQDVLSVEDVESRVVRVEARPNSSLVWTVENRGRLSWFTFEAGELRELHPAEDERLPGAALHLQNRVLSWRPGRRAVSEEPATSSIVKLYRRRRLDAAVGHHCRVRDCASRITPWRVPKILQIDRQACSVHFERVAGERLAVGSGRARSWSAVGLGLRRFQAAIPVDELPGHDRLAELGVVADLRSRVIQATGNDVEHVGDCLSQLLEAAERIPLLRRVAAHRDLHDGQILQAKSGPVVLDFDQLSAAEPVLDLANLSAHLVLREMQISSGDLVGAAGACALELIAGYGLDDSDEEASHVTHDALRFYQAATFVRLSLLYSIRPRWRALVPSLMQWARASLNELSHA